MGGAIQQLRTYKMPNKTCVNRPRNLEQFTVIGKLYTGHEGKIMSSHACMPWVQLRETPERPWFKTRLCWNSMRLWHNHDWKPEWEISEDAPKAESKKKTPARSKKPPADDKKQPALDCEDEPIQIGFVCEVVSNKDWKGKQGCCTGIKKRVCIELWDDNGKENKSVWLNASGLKVISDKTPKEPTEDVSKAVSVLCVGQDPTFDTKDNSVSIAVFAAIEDTFNDKRKAKLQELTNLSALLESSDKISPKHKATYLKQAHPDRLCGEGFCDCEDIILLGTVIAQTLNDKF